ncbi:outer membrane protein assembly factor BamE [Oryzomonas sagensis]|uniref:Outer membrane protein assembly factor BamE n=1 Tax=Oryzomonas sagensis TaxID=2603857 RepID=A0ABQ6TL31_9BACT|nr:outer membrane protein assembly factor BamE [Oryzomonas sagensis]KAB0668978.1 outer membrane protein assembly factor BamE [Oryzomonas sagensis]
MLKPMNLVLLAALTIILAGCGPHMTTTDLAPGMTSQEVIQKLGKPTSASLVDNMRYLIFKVNDDAFGRSDNFYAVGFKDDHLVSIAPLPEDMQENSIFDAVKKRGIFVMH